MNKFVSRAKVIRAYKQNNEQVKGEELAVVGSLPVLTGGKDETNVFGARGELPIKLYVDGVNSLGNPRVWALPGRFGYYRKG